ncbi:helix-turn-helix domain-containing protein [Streptomyces sp. NPDC001744]|uniref:AraC-like ligand-binding domain-containing protein n=1 Tax=Streptomyces sp. NPDC001744 TaxID=3364606 RepID=UPI00367FB436
MLTVLDTTCLPPGQRTNAWAETTALALVTTRFRFPDPAAFGARIRTTALGPAQLSTMTYGPLVSYRSPRLIRQSDPELYQLAVIVSGRQRIDQARRSAIMRPGEIVLYDSSRPFEASATGPGNCSSLVLRFPRRLVPLPDNAVAPLCGTALGAATGVRHVFRQTLISLTEAGTDLTAHDRQRLGSTVVDLAAAVIAQDADRTSALPAESRTTLMYHEITAFLPRHLHDPDLRPAAVAAAHSISPRYLQRIFQLHGTTPMDFVRQERIARCRRDLADPSLLTTPVGAIGLRWGYTRASDFTRAFRAATGMTPTEYRTNARGTAEPATPDRAAR